ncbi:MAG: hypothetical protein J6B34_00325 [Clostridia bacterium]|nr:hypothetical protein [Clostridia bacterium]
MIKGCQKRIVFLKDTGSDYFDEAYFVIKPCAVEKSESDIILEATRIANEAIEKGNDKEKNRGLFRVISFLLGCFAGIGATLLFVLI